MSIKITSHDQLADVLARWRNLEDCLLKEARFFHHNYNFELVFDYIWDDGEEWKVRADLDVVPKPVVLRLIGVEEITFVGALNPWTRARPDKINWSLEEVSVVRAVDRGDLIGLEAACDSGRRLEAASVSMELIEPQAGLAHLLA